MGALKAPPTPFFRILLEVLLAAGALVVGFVWPGPTAGRQLVGPVHGHTHLSATVDAPTDAAKVIQPVA